MRPLLELNPISYFVLLILCAVVFIYVRARNQYNRYIKEQSQPSEQHFLSEPKPLGNNTPNLPTFSNQELDQRKPPKEIDQSTLNPRNLQTFPEFGRGALSASSGFGNKTQPLGTTEKMFDGFRRTVAYEPVSRPVESSSVFANLGRSLPPSSYEVTTNPKNTVGFQRDIPTSHVPSTEANIREPNFQNPLANTQPKEEPFKLDGNHNEKPASQAGANKYQMELDNEYKVFSQEFKQKEGKTFHEEGKNIISPQRQGWGISTLDRVGHSPGSPFKIFESPFVEKDNKKRVKPNEPEGKSSRTQTANLISKKDSLGKKEEEGVSHETRYRESNKPVPLKLSKLVSKQERKSKLGQIFMDVNSDDEMAIEKERKPENKNKRPGVSSQSIDSIERDATRDKLFKDNNLHGKPSRVSEGKLLSQNLGSLSPKGSESQRGDKRKSAADIAYLSEIGGNLSMRRYIEKKATQDVPIKINRDSGSSNYGSKQSLSSFGDQGRKEQSFKSQEKEKQEEQKPFTSLIQNKGFPNPQKKTTTNGNSFLFAKEQKTPKEEPHPSNKSLLPIKEESNMAEEQKAVEKKQETQINVSSQFIFSQNEKKQEEKFSLLSSSDVMNVNKEPAKISNVLGGSSIFSQQSKPIEQSASTSIFSNKPAEAKPAEPVKEQTIEKTEPSKSIEQTEKESSGGSLLPKVSSGGFDLFKTVRAGAAFPKTEEKQEKSKEEEKSLFNNIEKDSKKEETSEAIHTQPEKKASMFSGFANLAEKKVTEESTSQKEQTDSKTEAKTFFGSSNLNGSSGLFGLVRNNSTQDQSKESELSTKKTEGQSLFGDLSKSTTSPAIGQSGLFGSSSTLTKKEDSKSTESPKGNFFNNKSKPAEAEKDPPKISSGLFSSNLLKKDSTPDANESPKNDSQKPISSLFSNSGAFSKTATSAKTDTPIFGSLKPIEGTDGTKPSGGIFGGVKTDSGLFKNNGGTTSAANGGLFGSSVSSGLFGNGEKKEGGLFSKLNSAEQNK